MNQCNGKIWERNNRKSREAAWIVNLLNIESENNPHLFSKCNQCNKQCYFYMVLELPFNELTTQYTNAGERIAFTPEKTQAVHNLLEDPFEPRTVGLT